MSFSPGGRSHYCREPQAIHRILSILPTKDDHKSFDRTKAFRRYSGRNTSQVVELEISQRHPIEIWVLTSMAALSPPLLRSIQSDVPSDHSSWHQNKSPGAEGHDRKKGMQQVTVKKNRDLLAPPTHDLYGSILPSTSLDSSRWV